MQTRRGHCPSRCQLHRGIYLYTIIFVYFNGQRPGAVVGMTLEDAKKAAARDCSGKRQQIVVRCTSHKSAVFMDHLC